MSDEKSTSAASRNSQSIASFNTLVPKGQLTAFQRWELDSFDPVPEATPINLPVVLAADVQAAQAAQQAAELQRIQQQAYDDGYANGNQAGYAAGLQQGQAAALQLQTLMQNLQIALSQFDEELAQSLLDLSLEIARKMVIEALQVNPEIILKIVSSAISNLPHFNQNAHLIMHPDDAELVRKQMGEQLTHAGWKIFSDPKIEIGGCHVETAHSQIDATNQARWQHIVESIGRDKSWLKNSI